MQFFQRYILGIKPGSTYGSNFRRLISRTALFTIIALIAECFITQSYSISPVILGNIGIAAIVWAMLYFVIVVLTIPFLTSEDFKPNPIRLFFDALISIFLTILAFGTVYRVYGIIPPENETLSRLDYYYFSAVTFSTLGFGDFRPTPSARLLAGLQAILGNLHLGIIVGVAFFAAQPSESKKNTVNKATRDKKNGK